MSDLCNNTRWKKWYPEKSDTSQNIDSKNIITLKKIILNGQKKDNVSTLDRNNYENFYLKGKEDGYNKGFVEGKKVSYELLKKDNLFRKKKCSFQNELELFYNNFKNSLDSIDNLVSNRLFMLAKEFLNQFVSNNRILIKDKILLSSIKYILRKELMFLKKIYFQINPKDKKLIKKNFKEYFNLNYWVFICDPKIPRGECKINSEYDNFNIKIPNYWKELFQKIKLKSKS